MWGNTCCRYAQIILVLSLSCQNTEQIRIDETKSFICALQGYETQTDRDGEQGCGSQRKEVTAVGGKLYREEIHAL